MLRLWDRTYHLRVVLRAVADRASEVELALAALVEAPPEADDLKKLLRSTKPLASEASRLSAELVAAELTLLPAFERVSEGWETTRRVKMGATGRSALLKTALADPAFPRKARAWAFAAIALRMDRECEDSDEFRERTGAWRREIKRIEAALGS
jgi:hypothetical protein